MKFLKMANDGGLENSQSGYVETLVQSGEGGVLFILEPHPLTDCTFGSQSWPNNAKMAGAQR